MSEKKKKQEIKIGSLVYALLVYDIWMFCNYFKDKFMIDCFETLFDYRLTNELIHKKDLTIIRMSFPNTMDEENDSVYDTHALKKFMNNEMESARGLHTVPPYSFGDCPLQVVSPLYLVDIVRNSERTQFEFYYVNNPNTYNKVEELKSCKC